MTDAADDQHPADQPTQPTPKPMLVESIGGWRGLVDSALPVIVFVGLGAIVGGAFTLLNNVLGPSRPSRVKSEPYECGLPSEVTRTFRFGISFYMIAMLFILFDIEVVFLYPVGVLLKASDSVFVLVEIITFVFLLLVGFVYVWRRGALNWK